MKRRMINLLIIIENIKRRKLLTLVYFAKVSFRVIINSIFIIQTGNIIVSIENRMSAATRTIECQLF